VSVSSAVQTNVELWCGWEIVEFPGIRVCRPISVINYLKMRRRKIEGGGVDIEDLGNSRNE